MFSKVTKFSRCLIISLSLLTCLSAEAKQSKRVPARPIQACLNWGLEAGDMKRRSGEPYFCQMWKGKMRTQTQRMKTCAVISKGSPNAFNILRSTAQMLEYYNALKGCEEVAPEGLES
jgi:hypothetical protein